MMELFAYIICLLILDLHTYIEIHKDTHRYIKFIKIHRDTQGYIKIEVF